MVGAFCLYRQVSYRIARFPTGFVVVKRPAKMKTTTSAQRRRSTIPSFSLHSRKEPDSLPVAPTRDEQSHAWEDRHPAASKRGYNHSVLLNAATDAVVRRPGNRWKSRHHFSYRVPPSVERRALLALPVIRDYLINCSRKGVSACVRSRLERSSPAV
jgi:hypothetical protein